MAAFSSGDTLNAIVGDIGQYATKIGFAGEDYPRSYFRSNIAVLREDEATDSNSNSKKDTKMADDAQTDETRDNRCPIRDAKYDFFNRPICSKSENPDDWNDGKWETSNPVDNTTGLWMDPEDSGPGSRGADWHDMLPLMIRHGFDSALGTEPEDYPFLLAERSYNPPPLRQQIVECLFEEMRMPAVFLARDAVLACYACGRTTGTVVDFGYGGTTVTPVYEGYVEQKGIRRSPVGTLEMDLRILKTLDHFTKKPFMPLYQLRRPSHAKRADPFHQLARLHIAQQCREEGVGAAVDTTSTAVAFAAPNAAFTLPDGQNVNIPSPHRFAVANLLLGQDDESVKYREGICEARKKTASDFVDTASQLEDDSGDDDEEDTPQFTEAAAVGISAPATRRGRRPSAKQSKAAAAAAATAAASAKVAEEEKKKRRAFKHWNLQKACAPYLQTQLDQFTSAPLASMVCDAAFRCDRDQQAQLLGNIILAGGGACLGPTEEAVPDYLRNGVETIIHAHTPGWRVKVLSPGVQERSICSWLGGSILGSLGTFHEMWITRAEYEEYGTAIVNRKCP